MHIHRLPHCCLLAAGFAALLAIGGCSVHPRPDDVTGLSTTKIAEHIRCEARTAIERKAIEMLRRAAKETGPNIEPPIPEAADLADDLANGTVAFADAKKYLKGKRERDFYDRYIKTAIAYDFTFDMTEDNLASTQLDFIKLITTPLSPTATLASACPPRTIACGKTSASSSLPTRSRIC